MVSCEQDRWNIIHKQNNGSTLILNYCWLLDSPQSFRIWSVVNRTDEIFYKIRVRTMMSVSHWCLLLRWSLPDCKMIQIINLNTFSWLIQHKMYTSEEVDILSWHHTSDSPTFHMVICSWSRVGVSLGGGLDASPSWCSRGGRCFSSSSMQRMWRLVDMIVRSCCRLWLFHGVDVYCNGISSAHQLNGHANLQSKSIKG